MSNFINWDKKNITIFFSICFIVHSILSMYLGVLKGWGGDEWFSYNDFTIMALPFSVITKIQIYILGPISLDDFLYYKMQGLTWIALLFFVLYKMYYNDKRVLMKKYILFLVLFISISPFIIGQTHYFRYYSLYLFSAFIIYFLIWKKGKKYIINRRMFFGVLLVSPFLHFFIFWQLFFYISFKELIIIFKKGEKFKVSVIFILFILGILNIDYLLVNIWNTFMHNYDYLSFDHIQHRGFSFGTIIKPFNAIFVYLFGRDIVPLEYFSLTLMYLIVGISLIYIVITNLKEYSNSTINLFISGIIPFFGIYIILDPMTLPGMTQADAHHGLFFIPWLIFLLFKLNEYSFGKVINISLFSSFLYADYLMITMDYPNWEKVDQTINSNKNPIITDTPGDLSLNIINDNIIWFQDTMKVRNAIQNNDTVCIVMQGWGNYQVLSLEQKWNSINGTSDAFGFLENLIIILSQNNFDLIDAYSRFPLHCMVFVKNNAISHQSSPWLFDIKYRDLKIPLIIDNKRIIGFQKLNKGKEILLDSSFYYFIQADDPNEDDSVIEISNIDASKKKYILDEENDAYRSYYCRSINQDSVVYTIKKRPLVSNSLRHPGSMLNSQLRLYKNNNYGNYKTCRVINEKIILYLAIIDDGKNN
jgi:hypothetical protein